MLQVSSKIRPLKKWAEDLNGHFSREDIPIIGQWTHEKMLNLAHHWRFTNGNHWGRSSYLSDWFLKKLKIEIAIPLLCIYRREKPLIWKDICPPCALQHYLWGRNMWCIYSQYRSAARIKSCHFWQHGWNLKILC